MNYLRAKHVMTRFAISKSTLRRWIKNGIFPSPLYSKNTAEKRGLMLFAEDQVIAWEADKLAGKATAWQVRKLDREFRRATMAAAEEQRELAWAELHAKAHAPRVLAATTAGASAHAP